MTKPQQDGPADGDVEDDPDGDEEDEPSDCPDCPDGECPYDDPQEYRR
jgi:hypothetical protein